MDNKKISKRYKVINGDFTDCDVVIQYQNGVHYLRFYCFNTSIEIINGYKMEIQEAPLFNDHNFNMFINDGNKRFNAKTLKKLSDYFHNVDHLNMQLSNYNKKYRLVNA